MFIIRIKNTRLRGTKTSFYRKQYFAYSLTSNNRTITETSIKMSMSTVVCTVWCAVGNQNKE